MFSGALCDFFGKSETSLGASAHVKMESIWDFVNLYTIAAGLIAGFWLFSRSKHSFWRNHNVKCFAPVPIFGSMFKYVFRLECLNEVYDQMYQEMGEDLHLK